MMRALLVLMLLTGSTAAESWREPIQPSPWREWADDHGPQFVFTWSRQEQETALRALDGLVGMRGIEPYILERQAKIVSEVASGGFGIWDATEKGWVQHEETAFPFPLSQVITLRMAVRWDTNCRAEDQDVDEMDFLAAGVECYIRNTAAIALYEHIAKSRHMTPGGARH